MSPDKQRIAIAEACGWKNVRVTKLEPTSQEIICGDMRGVRRRVPGFLVDLNEMHEVEKTLNRMQRWDYIRELYRRTNGDFEFHCATPAQRCEAFLRTIGRWEESP